MKRVSIIVALMLLSSSFLMIRCTDAFKDVQLIVNADVFKYTALMEVSSSSGASLDDATVTLSGQDVSRIYNMKGYRDFKINGGFLTFAVDPHNPPLENDPIAFNVIIQKTGFSTVNIPVVIRLEDSSSLRYIAMIDQAHPPVGIEAKTNHLALVQGKVGNDTTIYVGPGTCTCTTAKATIGLKAGTQFKDGSGNVFADAATIQMRTLTVDAFTDKVLMSFPGGSLTQKKIQMEGGSFAAGTLLPAGLIELAMTTNGKEIKGFTTPMQVSIQLNPDYVNPGTGQVIKIGDELKVFSYSTDNGYFQYETTGTVFNQGGHLAVIFSTTHLSWFMVGEFVAACNDHANLGFRLKADWLDAGITTPVTLKIYSTKNAGSATDLMIATIRSTVKNGDILTFGITPGMPIIVKAFDGFGNEMYKGSVKDPCNSTTKEISLAQSKATSYAKTTLQLYVRCPDGGKSIDELPTFYLFSKLAGAPDQDYTLLGLVTHGYISTTLLNVNNKYDFKAVWNNTVKVVHSKSVRVDNTTPLGDSQNEGILIGTKAGATNLHIIEENCT